MTHEDRDLRAAGPERVRLLEGRIAPTSGSPSHGGGDPRYRLRASVEPFVDGAGELFFVRAGAPDLKVHGPGVAEIAAIELLAADWHSEQALLKALGEREIDVDPERLSACLASLAAADVLLGPASSGREASSAGDTTRFSRQLLYLAELGDELDIQRRLRSAKVVILGCGGLGSWAAASLACLGLGELVLVDDDRVALENLNRQILFPRDAIGRRKVEVASEWLRRFDPEVSTRAVPVRVRGPADVSAIAAGASALVLAADWPPYELARWVNVACLELGVPFIAAGQLPPMLKVGPTYRPGVGPCFACHETALRVSSPAYDDYVAYRRRHPLTAATLGPASAAVGALLAMELMHLLAGRPIATDGAAVLIDMRTLTTRREEVPRDPDCPACKDL